MTSRPSAPARPEDDAPVDLHRLVDGDLHLLDQRRDGDSELAEFFRKAQAESRKGGEQGKQLLKARLGEDS